MTRGRTHGTPFGRARVAGISTVIAFALLTGCSSTPTPEAAEPSVTSDSRDALVGSLLTAGEFPVRGWSEVDTLMLPAEDLATSSGGTPAPDGSDASLCGAGDIQDIDELFVASGVSRSFGGGGLFVQALFPDESGELAELVTGRIEACIDQGPVVTTDEAGTEFGHVWADETLPPVDGVFTASFSSATDDPLNVTAIGVANTDGVTLLTYSEIKQLRTILEPEEFAAITNAAYAKLTE